MRRRILPRAAEPAVRDAATIVLLRRAAGVPQVLMGQRGAAAAFMPDKFVFPGGAVDPEDLRLAGGLPAGGPLVERLTIGSDPAVARALPLAAIRELWEETGLRIGRADGAGLTAGMPETWRGFCEGGLCPDPAGLRFVFRAVTPPGRPRRFDARFFLADAAAVAGDLEDFSAADDELRHLQWLDIATARGLPLPFITEVVLSEVEALLAEPDRDRPVPYFHHAEDGSHFRLL